MKWPEYADTDQEKCRQWAAELDKFGVENVRIALAENFSLERIDRRFAWRWLRYQDEEKRKGDRRIAKWTLVASVVAAAAGIAAAVAAVLALR
jgi:hypothetical protein